MKRLKVSIVLVLVACSFASGCGLILCLLDPSLPICLPLQSPALTFNGDDTDIVSDPEHPNQALMRGRALSMHSDGSSVVVYHGTGSFETTDGIYGQRYDAQGGELGTEFRISSSDGYYQVVATAPAVDHMADGSFVVAWIGTPADAQGSGVLQPMSRVYAANGNPLGTEIDPGVVIAPIDSYVGTGYSRAPLDVGGGESGFVVVWEGAPDYNTPTNIFGQRFGLDGTPVGTEFKVNTFSSGVHLDPSIGVAGGDGSFVVAWTSAGVYTYPGGYQPGKDGAYGAVVGQRFDANATKRGTEFQVNTFETYSEDQSDIAVAHSGSFVVVWRTQYGDDGYTVGVGPRLSDSITMRRYASNGNPIDDDEIHINSYTTGGQIEPSIAMANDGSFVVAWHSAPGYNEPEMRDDEDGGLFGRCFDTNGDGGVSEFHLNSYIPGRQSHVSLATNGTGNFVAAWTNQDYFFGAPTGSRRRFTETDCQTVPIGPSPIELTKGDGGAFWLPGGVLTYTLSVTNNTGETTNVTLDERVPTRTMFSAENSPAGWDCSGSGEALATCTYVISDLADGATTDVQFAVTVDGDAPSLWWLYNVATATADNSAIVSQGREVTPLALCDMGNFDSEICSIACFIVPDFCAGDGSGLLARLASATVRAEIGYPELQIRDEILAGTRGGARATDLYYEQSANAVAAAMSDSNVASTALAAGDEWAPIFAALVLGTADSVMISQDAVDATMAFTTALRAAAGPELGEVMDRELPRLDIPGWVGMPVEDIVSQADNLTCEGFEDQLFCGEINGDCRITATDALAVLRIAVGTLASVPEADLDGNGSVTATDALQTLVIAVGVQGPTDACNVQ